MKIGIYISLLFFVMNVGLLQAIDPLKIDTTSYSYYTGLAGHKQCVYSCKIINNSNEDYVTWISLEPIRDKTNAELIYDFFKKRRGDFNYIEIMYEEIDNLDMSIGYTFIKKLLPNQVFTYSILKKNSNTTFYKDRIVIMKKTEIEQYLRLKLVENYFFQNDNIILAEFNLADRDFNN